MPKKDNSNKKKETNAKTQKKNINIVKKRTGGNNTVAVNLTLFNKVLYATEKAASVLESENH